MITGWKKVKLASLTNKIQSGGTPKSDNLKFYNGTIPFASIADMSDSNKYLYNTKKSITNMGLNNCSAWIVPSDSILYSIYATLGLPIINKIDTSTSQAILGIETKKHTSKYFLYYWLLYQRSFLNQFSSQTTQANLNAEIVRNFLVFLPKSKQEQQKIAKILTSIDDSIENTNNIIAKQKRIKTGLMQDLLTCGIDEDGNIRNEATHKFKDSLLGRIPVEWKILQLKSLCNDFIVPMRDKPKEFLGDIPWCRIEDFDGKFLSKTKSNQYVDQNTIKKMNLKIHPIDTVLCSCSAIIGKTTIVKKPLITNQTFIGLVPNRKLLNSEFLYYLLPTYIQRLENLSSGTTIVYLSREKFETFEIVTPSEIEQQKISNILSKQDEAIEQEEQKLKKLQSIKKALMQDLLTGKVRVNYE